jgi:prepilin peptidase CpaA
MVTLELVLAALVAGLLLVATVTDARERIIPDWVNAAIALAAPVMWWERGAALWPDLAIQAAVVATAFLFVLLAFATGQMGGGDVKLIVALALFMPPWTFFMTFWGFALVGGIMTAALYVLHLRRRTDAPFENPYGIAIAIGGVMALADRYRLIDATPVLQALMLPAMVVCVAALAWRIVARIRAHRGDVHQTIS